eukprot:1011308-Pelagomonas_calceolata.AAC.1
MLAAQSQAPCNAFRRGCMHRPRGRLHVCCAVKQRTGKQICCSKTLKANKGAEVRAVLWLAKYVHSHSTNTDIFRFDTKYAGIDYYKAHVFMSPLWRTCIYKKG